MWGTNKAFVAWLDAEELGTDEVPLDDDVLDLMCRAWNAGSKSRSAVVNPKWKMPDPPDEGAVAAYFQDGSEVFLGWCNPATGDPAGMPDNHDIEWPFLCRVADISDLTKLGFQDLEDFPEE